jgi:hypothetical protein
MDDIIDKITHFLEYAGIKFEFRSIESGNFLPGLKLENGALIIDKEKLLYPGDILHEAGHLAGMPPHVRESISNPLPDTDLFRGNEMFAMGWSYAACKYIGIDPAIVFHEDGYRGASDIILSDYESGIHLGLNLMQWLGMSYDKKMAAERNVLPYPNMIRWLRPR